MNPLHFARRFTLLLGNATEPRTFKTPSTVAATIS